MLANAGEMPLDDGHGVAHRRQRHQRALAGEEGGELRAVEQHGDDVAALGDAVRVVERLRHEPRRAPVERVEALENASGDAVDLEENGRGLVAVMAELVNLLFAVCCCVGFTIIVVVGLICCW